MPDRWSVVILSGGRSSRMGFDKASASVADRTLLEWLLGAIPADVECILVGPAPTVASRPFTVTREEPAGGGPVAGIAAGLGRVTTPIVAIVAVDMPLAGSLLPGLVGELAAAAAVVDAVLPNDETERAQPLAGVYRTASVRRALAALEHLDGRAVRELVAHLSVRTVTLPDPGRLVDVDSKDDLERLRRSVRTDGAGTAAEDSSMDEWVAAAAQALGLEQAVDVDLILDVAREAAHGVARPAAPVTTFLLGCAVGSGQSLEEAAARLTALAQGWPRPE